MMVCRIVMKAALVEPGGWAEYKLVGGEVVDDGV